MATSGQDYADYVTERIVQPLGMADTRPYFPRTLHGKQMAIGYSGFGREQKREKVVPFDAKALAPAFGFTSTVNDLARFASWQFRTLAGQDDSVLQQNTLREMHRVHWVDPDWETTWGIGFNVRKLETTTAVGHGGGCPGYITAFMMVPSKKVAAIALTNAGDGPAGLIAQTMLAKLGPALAKAQKPASEAAKPATGVNLKDYAGNFSGGVWGGELAVRVWGDQLSLVNIPDDNLKDITKLKHQTGDTFVRLNKQGEAREAWVFKRDDAGRVVSVNRHSQTYMRI